MDETGSRKHDWVPVALATIAVSAGFAAALTYFTVGTPDANESAPGFLQLTAAWLGFTLLLTMMFAAGIWRMTSSNSGAGIGPFAALIALASVVGLCGLSPVLVFQFSHIVGTQVILYAVLALALAVAFAVVYFLKR
jgi:hypothetical protein